MKVVWAFWNGLNESFQGDIKHFGKRKWHDGHLLKYGPFHEEWDLEVDHGFMHPLKFHKIKLSFLHNHLAQ